MASGMSGFGGGLKRRQGQEFDEFGSMESLTSAEALGSGRGHHPSFGNIAEALEARYMEKRDELIGDDGVIRTPLKVLKDIAFNFGAPLEVTTFEVHMPTEVYGFDSLRNSVVLSVGKYTGRGESVRHRLAVQLAAADLLEQMKADQGEGSVPDYGLLPGCRTSPMIYEDLRELCNLEKLAGPPKFTQIIPASVGSTDLFAFNCVIGQLKSTGTSDSIFLAKRMAARAMYEELTAEKYPEDHVASGSGCLREEDLRSMGIVPVLSERAKRRNANVSETVRMDAATEGSRPVELGPEDIYDDDFGEEEDCVVVMQRQLGTLKISKVEDDAAR